MSKKFLFLIILILYVGNSNCAAAREDFDRVHKARISAFEVTDNIDLILKNLNNLPHDLRISQIDKQAKEDKLNEYRIMIITKINSLDQSKANLRWILQDICTFFIEDCLNSNDRIYYSSSHKNVFRR